MAVALNVDAPLFAQDQYQSFVYDTTPLQADEERYLLAQCPVDMAARDRLVAVYQPLVLNISRRYVRRNGAMELMDLVQEGNIGLLQALDSYNPILGTAFVTHAFTCIRAAITASLWQEDGLIRLPDHKARALRRLDQIEAALCVKVGRDPTQSELAKVMNLSLPALRELLVLRARQICDLDTMLTEDLSVADVVADVTAAPQPAAAMVADAIAMLPPVERAVIRCRFALSGEDVRPRRQVAKQLGMTPQQVERIEQHARRLIAQYLAQAVA